MAWTVNEDLSARLHWGNVWNGRDPTETSWYQAKPSTSLALIEQVTTPTDHVLDVGGGASTLVDHLLEAGYEDVTVLDIAEESLERAQVRLGAAGEAVSWITGDVRTVEIEDTVDLWHDRAVFHFFSDPGHIRAYRRQAERAVPVGGHAIVATFAPDGPKMCSGLPVTRYDAEDLSAALGDGFELLEARRVMHTTPWETDQSFQYGLFERVDA